MSLGVPSPRSPYVALMLTAAATPERAERPQTRSTPSRSHKERSSVSTALFYPSLEVRGKRGPFRITDGALMERSACFQSLLLHIVQSLQYRSSPSRLPSQSSHRERRRPVSTVFVTCLSRNLVRGAHPPGTSKRTVKRQMLVSRSSVSRSP